jgi:nucleotide-binding universal stress UspA family protein
MPTSFIVATDGSPAAIHALRTAAKIANDNDHIRILHVQTPKEHFDEIHETKLVGPLYQVGSDISEEAIHIVSQLLKLCRELGVPDFKEDVITQKAGVAKSITSYCADVAKSETNNVILVLGTRELGFFARAFLGSVADYCVHNSTVPVLVARQPNTSA